MVGLYTAIRHTDRLRRAVGHHINAQLFTQRQQILGAQGFLRGPQRLHKLGTIEPIRIAPQQGDRATRVEFADFPGQGDAGLTITKNEHGFHLQSLFQCDGENTPS